MQENKILESKIEKWREKNNQNRKLKNAAVRSLKSVRNSRERIREKCKALQKKNQSLERQVHGLKKQILRSKTGSLSVKRHHYDAAQISLCVNLRNSTNSSLRSCLQIIKLLSLLLGLELFSPSIASIRNWEIKMGYHQLGNRVQSDREWMLILDESIMVGQQKMLLLLGVELSKYSFDAPLNFEDIEVLGLYVGSSCKWENVQQQIRALHERGYVFKYAVSDAGSSICKGLRVSGITRVEDCTHALGLLIKKRYKGQQEYETFSKQAAAFKRKVSTSKYAVYMPPAQRSKARFLNLSELSNWAIKLLKLAKQYKQESSKEQVYERIKWIENYESLIDDISVHQKLLNELFKILKNRGLSQETKQCCQKVILDSKADEEIKKGITNYLEVNTSLEGLPQQLICCSDIIESLFGYYKNRMSKNKNIGFTAGTLALAGGRQYKNVNQIKSAMEQTRLTDISKWEEQNLIPSLLKQRKKLFKSVAEN